MSTVTTTIVPAPRTEWVDRYPDAGLDFGDCTDIYEGEA